MRRGRNGIDAAFPGITREPKPKLLFSKRQTSSARPEQHPEALLLIGRKYVHVDPGIAYSLSRGRKSERNSTRNVLTIFWVQLRLPIKLGYLGSGSSELQVERLLPDEIARMNSGKNEQISRTEPAMPTPDVLAAAAAVEAPASALPAPVVMQVNSDAAAVQQTSVAPPTSTATAAPGFYLQLGSYTQLVNADAARNRLQQGRVSLPPVEVVEYGMFYRLFSGPFATRDEAVAVAAQLQEGGGAKPLVVQR